MVFNWAKFALNELYQSCGAFPDNREVRARNSRWPFPIGISNLEKACSAYTGKTNQIIEISKVVSKEQLLILDYDDLLKYPETGLSQIFDFVDVKFNLERAAMVKKQKSYIERPFDLKTASFIQQYALPAFQRAKALCTPIRDKGCNE